jgi:hypothetical protein
MQHERGGETSNAAADNNDLHRSTHKPTGDFPNNDSQNSSRATIFAGRR